MHAEASMKVRKTISISEEAQEFLKELSDAYGKSQSRIIEELIMEKAREHEYAKKLKAFDQLIKNAKRYSGKIGNKTLKEIKLEKAGEL